MLKEKIIELFNSQKFDELEELVEKQDIKELAAALSEIDKNLLLQIFPKLSEKISAEVFILFSTELQTFLTENISDIEFQAISEELLDNDVEKTVSKSVLNEILLKAEPDTRHEKLLDIIDNIKNKKFTSLKPILKDASNGGWNSPYMKVDGHITESGQEDELNSEKFGAGGHSGKILRIDLVT